MAGAQMHQLLETRLSHDWPTRMVHPDNWEKVDEIDDGIKHRNAAAEKRSCGNRISTFSDTDKNADRAVLKPLQHVYHNAPVS